MEMKKVISLLIALTMLFSLSVTAFAQGISLAADPNVVAAGEKVSVTISIDDEITNYITGQYRLFFNDSYFAFDAASSQALYSGAVVLPSVKDDGQGNKYAAVNLISMTEITVAAGSRLATLVFTAKQDITAETAATFRTGVYAVEKMDGTELDNTFSEKSINVTVKPAAVEYDGYTVAILAKNPTINVGENAVVALKIANKDISSYNAYYLEVSYDSNILHYVGINTDAAVTNDSESGKLTIAGYGKNRTGDIELSFTGEETGESTVKVQNAKVDAAANANTQDAPGAAVTADAAAVTVDGYTVALDEDFIGAGSVTAGEDYSFTAKNINYDYAFNATMGGEAVEVKDNSDGTYTIGNVSGNLDIRQAAKTGKTRTVTITGADVSGEETAVYGTDYTFTIDKQTGYNYAVSVKIGSAIYKPTMSEDGKVFTIAGSALTGDVTVTVTKTEIIEGAITIIETGDAWGDVTVRGTWPEGGGQITPSENDTYSLKIKPADGKTVEDYVVTLNGAELTGSGDKIQGYKYSFMPTEVAVDGEITIDVSYKKEPQPEMEVSTGEYMPLEGGRNLYFITAAAELDEGKTLAYGENQMYWSSKYGENGAYVWLVISDTAPEDAGSAITVVDGTRIEIAYNGDVNLTETVDINDAQLVWNMYNVSYTDFDTVSRRKFLEADMNGDLQLSVADAAAVVSRINGTAADNDVTQ